jgi:hypothetical protein
MHVVVHPKLFKPGQCRFLPESIPWLCANQRVSEAEDIIRKAAKFNNVPMPTRILLSAEDVRFFFFWSFLYFLTPIIGPSLYVADYNNHQSAHTRNAVYFCCDAGYKNFSLWAILMQLSS